MVATPPPPYYYYYEYYYHTISSICFFDISYVEVIPLKPRKKASPL